LLGDILVVASSDSNVAALDFGCQLILKFVTEAPEDLILNHHQRFIPNLIEYGFNSKVSTVDSCNKCIINMVEKNEQIANFTVETLLSHLTFKKPKVWHHMIEFYCK